MRVELATANNADPFEIAFEEHSHRTWHCLDKVKDFFFSSSLYEEEHTAVDDDTKKSTFQAVKPTANRAWLVAHAGRYNKRWLALRDGELLGEADSIIELTKQVSAKYGVSFPSNEIMLTTGF